MGHQFVKYAQNSKEERAGRWGAFYESKALLPSSMPHFISTYRYIVVRSTSRELDYFP
jgi:hypothetical protein